VKAAGSVSAPKVADALRAGSFKTVIGELSFNAKGDRKSTDYVVYRWHEGAYTQIADKP
jgi:branched-chain amino acid transport system substrate-binding protein